MHRKTFARPLLLSIFTMAVVAVPVGASGQDNEDSPRRTRIALGPQIIPSYPGSDKASIRPLIDFSRAKGGEEFAFEAPDESFGFPVYRNNEFSFGPSFGLKGKRSSADVGGTLPKVDFTIEVGGFMQFQASEMLRLRADLRRGVNGHDGFVGVLSADYVMRDGDKQLLSIGPRVTVTDQNYQDAYFGILPADAVSSGLSSYNPGGGLQAIGGTIGYLQQITPRWGIYSYAKYDRLVGDPSDSPIVSEFGSRNQYSGGVALSYTFGDGVD